MATSFPRPRRGFTLTELLVTLLITAVLGVVLWSVLDKLGLVPPVDLSPPATAAEVAHRVVDFLIETGDRLSAAVGVRPRDRAGAADPPPAAASAPSRRKALGHLAEAERQAEAARDKRLKAVSDFFAQSRKGAKPFAGDALGWGSKWELIKGTLGLSEEDAHKKFLQEAFCKHVFSADDLKRALEGAVKGYVLDLEDIEAKLLVKLRADLADGGEPAASLPPHLRDDEAFQAEYRRLMQASAVALDRDMGVLVAREVVSFVAADVAAVVLLQVAEGVAVELGVEAGILSAGAASGVVTFGAGLVAAVAIDYLLGLILKEAGYDPEEEVAGKTRDSIDKVRQAMLEGKRGLGAELSKVHDGRARLRKEVVESLLKEGGNP